MKQIKEVIKPSKWWWLVGAGFFLILVGWAWYYYQQHLPLGLRLAGDSIGGLRLNAIDQRLDASYAPLMSGVVFTCHDRQVKIEPSATNAIGVAEEYYLVDKQGTKDRLMTFGHQGAWWQRLAANWRSLWFGAEVNWRVVIDTDFVRQRLSQACGNLEKPLVEADVSFQPELKVTAGQAGLNFDYQQAVDQMFDNLSHGRNPTIVIPANNLQPAISEQELRDWLQQSAPLPATNSLELSWQDQRWQLNTANVSKLWGPIKQQGQLQWQPRVDKITAYLQTELAPQVDKPAQEPRFEVNGQKATIFQQPLAGSLLQLEASANNIASALRQGSSSVELAVTVIKPNSTSTAEWLDGIVELIGVGTSNFTGSPANRRHNIKTGARAIDGLIIKAGEEFSMLKALGAINAETGYLPELVIKENKTVPEYGGGLCQIGTTMFRAAVDSGLPITQRRNHSYRVSYYEPAGTDATIYDPAPDFRFLNDTGKNVLLQAKVVGSSLRFELWGTKDGRQIVYTKPTIYNIVKPGEPKLIETDELAPGQKKCVETAHNGADAYFDYRVSYPNGEVKEKRFSSHYVPWRAVCLIGRSATASSTPSSSTSSISKQE